MTETVGKAVMPLFGLARRAALRPFFLYRADDVSGMSGTGVVAVGTVLPSGRAVMEWQSRWPTVTVFRSVEDIVRIHGHGGKTVLCWGLPPQGAARAPAGLAVSVRVAARRAGGWLSRGAPRLSAKRGGEPARLQPR